MRAIAERAPEPVRELYRQGLIGAKEAAKLGPKNPSPEEAAKVTSIAIEATKVARAEPAPKTPREKRQVQRRVNETVRAALGPARTRSDVIWASIERLPRHEQQLLCDRLVRHLEGTGA